MKRTLREKIQDCILSFLRYFVLVWMRFDAKTTYTLNDGFHFKRTEPYVLLGNHVFLFDVIHIQKRFKVVPYAVASQALFAKQPTKFLFTKLTHAIPKSKGSADIRAAKLIFKHSKKYPILIFPEGDTTFFGETNYIEESTYKLIKKLKIDVGKQEELLKSAEAAVHSKNYVESIALSKQSWEGCEKILHEHLSGSFSSAQSLIHFAKNRGEDVSAAEDLLSRARSAVEASEYEDALNKRLSRLHRIGDQKGN